MIILKKKSKTYREKINHAPSDPGCYLFSNSEKKIIYVGKAKNIKNRIKSYFSGFKNLEERKQLMIEESKFVEFITVDSEVEALILETNLIKKYLPKFNVLMRDDKTYSWILVEKQLSKKNDFPRIRIIRDKDKTKYQGEFFGPYSETIPLKNILKNLRKLFPYASCNRKIIQLENQPLLIKSSDSNPCLYFHIGLCNAPCAGKISRKEYNKNILQIKKFLRGEKKEIINELEASMKKYSENLEFEKASKIRDRIKEIKYVLTSLKIDSSVDDIVITELKEKQRNDAINNLIAELNFPSDKLKNHSNFKIECYDISNLQGTNAVGAMTVMVNGVLRNDLYRKFKIKMENTPNDFAMMQEILRRRFFNYQNYPNIDLKSDESFSILPDLIIVDGGKGQLSASFSILQQFNLHNTIPIIGLAKKNEEIFKINYQFTQDEYINLSEKFFKRIMLKRNSEELYLVQRIRDESHRFGITFHRKTRSKVLFKTTSEKA